MFAFAVRKSRALVGILTAQGGLEAPMGMATAMSDAAIIAVATTDGMAAVLEL